MAKFSLKQTLNILTPRMVTRMLVHPARTAIHVTQAERPELGGIAVLIAACKRMIRGRQAPPLCDAFLPLGKVLHATFSKKEGLTVEAQGGHLNILPLDKDLIRIRGRRDGLFTEPFSYAVERQEDAGTATEVKHTETEDSIQLMTDALDLSIDRHSCQLTAQDKNGHSLLRESEGLRLDPASEAFVWRAALDRSVACYGLGEKASQLNHAGRRFELWNVDPGGYDRGDDPIYMSIPFLLTLSEGIVSGLFFDNPYRAWIDLGASTPGTLEYRAQGGEFRLYLMSGTPQQVLERYTELTGHMPLPPLWALGFHQCRWSYYPQSRVLEVANEFRKRRLPCDVIHLDIHYMDDYRCFTWDRRHFPDPRGMLEALHAQGMKVMTIIDPGIQIRPGYRVYEEGIAQDAFVKYPDGRRFNGPVWPGDCHFPDFSKPEVRAWWGRLYQGLIEDGVDAFWNDMNEPALITRQLGATVPDIVCHDGEGRRADHAEIHNTYGMLMARASAEGIAELRPDRRPLILSRSGWAGIQRYAIHWTADNMSTWDHLHLSIQMALNLGLSGVALTGPDTGGFGGGPSAELFARWMQVGAFMPFFRVHSMIGSPDQEPWAFGAQVEAICRQYLDLRYRLLPYIYTATWQSACSGIPIVRALSFAYPEDRATYDLDDAYLFGDSILVAPVLAEGAREREVYLPKGLWFDFWTGEQHPGGQWIRVQAPLERLPLFVKAGAVLPFWPVQQYVGEKSVDVLDLYAYAAPRKHESWLYEDDGLTPGAEHTKEMHRVSAFGLEIGQLSRRIVAGSYKPTYSRIRAQLLGVGEGTGVQQIEGGKLLSQRWDAELVSLTVELEAAGEFVLTFG